VTSLFWINNANLKQAALAYAKKEWPVVPLLPREKRPLTDEQLGLFNGLKHATTDERLIDEWWTLHPNANIGLRTGVVFDVLDLDGPSANAAMIKAAPRYRHEGPIASTGKGYHLFFAASGSRNHAGLMGAPVDFRGVNGYVVAPPSVHPMGHRYKWARDSVNLPEIPEWLMEHIFPPKPERTTDPNDPAIKEALEKSEDILTIFSAMALPITRVGNRYSTFCPFHKDDTASLVIYPDTNSFFCFGCGAWGDPLNVKRWLKTGRLRRTDAVRLSPNV
jgi:hypothetical protein